MKRKDNSKEIVISEGVKKLVVARINAQMPSNFALSIGSHGRISKEKMIIHIEKGDEIGKKIVESHLRFLRAQARGDVTKALTSIE